MLGKLMKYEFKATARIFLPLYGALLVVSFLNFLFIGWGFRTPTVISGAVSVIMVVAIGVVTFILMLQRFNSNLLGSEGYLMFTLPVRPDSLILSKLFVSAVWFVASFLVVTVAVLVVFASSNVSFAVIWNSMVEALSKLPFGGAELARFITEGFFATLFSLLSSILFLYACLALSLLVNRRRLLFAFAAFLVISTAGQILGTAFASLALALHLQDLLDEMNRLTLVHMALDFSLLGEILTGILFYFVTRVMLTRRLNLE